MSAPVSADIVKKFSVKGKVFKEEPNELEKSVGQALYDLQVNPQMKDLGAELKDLFILAAIEVKVTGSKNAVVVFIPYIRRMQYRKIQSRLVRELEKKFGKFFVFVAQRRILKRDQPNNQVKRQKRPYSRTVTAVHDGFLEDICYPADIAGRRERHKIDGSVLFKVLLNKSDAANVENRVVALSKVYKRLTNKDVVFSFQ